jgi:hypothetical protein
MVRGFFLKGLKGVFAGGFKAVFELFVKGEGVLKEFGRGFEESKNGGFSVKGGFTTGSGFGKFLRGLSFDWSPLRSLGV